jgi:hypothetical protein
MAFEWRFQREPDEEWSWQVWGSAGPIACSGRCFSSLRACMRDAIRHGYVAGSRERRRLTVARARDTARHSSVGNGAASCEAKVR